MKNFNKFCFNVLLLIIVTVNCESGDYGFSEYERSSFLPSPPNGDTSPNSRQGGGGIPIGEGLAGTVGVPPQNNPVNPFGPGLGGPGGLPNGFVPFGLNHIILIIVPLFKTKLHKLPDWITSTVKISMPITVFFDQLTVPPGMFVPGIGGFPLPLGVPPPIGLGLPPPGGPVSPSIPVSPPAPAPPPQNVGSSPVSSGYNSPGGYTTYPQTAYPYSTSSYDAADPEDMESDEEEDGYESGYQEDERKRRWKRETFANQTHHQRSSRRKRDITFNETIHSAERAALIPHLENLLENSGLGGKSCLLRTICEVHEAPLKHYGLLGELFTMFLSVSRSVFAESHLPEYLHAEKLGKSGDCSKYFKHCEHTIFSWEEVKRQKKKKEMPSYMFNVIDEVL